MEEGTALRDFYTSVLLSQNSGDYSGAARKLAAAAGSTVTSLGIAQRDSPARPDGLDTQPRGADGR